MLSRAGAFAIELGLVVLTWSALCGLEIALHAPAIDRGAVLAHLPGAALAFSAALVAVVALARVIARALSPKLPSARVRVLLLVLTLVAAAAWPAALLAEALVEGAWIATHPEVRAIAVALFIALELLWLTACVVYVLALSLDTRGRIFRFAWWLVALSAPLLASIVLQGPLKAYPLLAQHAIVPIGVILVAIALRITATAPRIARALGVIGLLGGFAALAAGALDTDQRQFARTEALASTSFLAVAETLALTEPARLGHFDFERVRLDACPKPRTLPPLPLQDAQRRNVIFLSIDTMRRDAIGKRFGTRAVAPNIEAFGKRSVFFDRAVAPASGTLFSLGSALSGLSVSQLVYMRGLQSTVIRRIRRELPRRHIVFPDWPSVQTDAFDKLLMQEADTYYVNRKKHESSFKPFVAALEAARAANERGFFWLHLVEPHLPYGTQDGFDFGDSVAERYYSEVAYEDANIGRALTYLEKNGYFEDSLIIFFSDHGEALGEDGGYTGHGVSMRARFTDIPLYVRYPGIEPRVSHAAVTLTSLAATVLHFLGRDIPEALTDCSLLEPESALARCPMPVSTSYGLRTEFVKTALKNGIRTREDLVKRQKLIMEKHRFAPEIAFTTSEHRYLIDLKTGTERLFERSDGSERHNLVRKQPHVTQRFRLAVTRWADQEATRIACALQKK